MSALFGGVYSGQIPLPLYTRSEHRLERFVDPQGGHTLDQVLSFVEQGSETGLYLCAEPGQGKTHLLVGLAERLGYPRASYLAMRQVENMSAERVLEGLEQHALICLDDIDRVAGLPEWEIELFHLFNRCQAEGRKLIWSASRLPGNAGFELPDLTSRLLWGMVMVLPPLSDVQKQEILVSRARERGIALSTEVLHYLFSHSQRGMADLMEVLDRLDHESLTEKRSITIPFIKKIMNW